MDQHSRCQLVTEAEIHSFSRTLSLTDLQSIAAELNLSGRELEQCRTCEPQSISVQAFKVLSHWVLSQGGSATVVNFVQRMRSARIADDVIKSALLHAC